MNILLIGSGGREHALSHSMSKSPLCDKLYIAPGNAGTAELGENVDLNPTNAEAVIEFCETNTIRLVVIGPEQPLVDGLADKLRASAINVVGPGSQGAELEGSKDYSKKFMQRHDIPTAAYRSFNADELEAALSYLDLHATPIVVKASGLAAGKGVLICESVAEAKEGVRQMLTGESFGDSGKTVVIEEFLTGIEMSVFILTDGSGYVLLPEAKDYKRIGEGDTGLNTGGMGAISPVPFADESLMKKVDELVIGRTLQGLRKDGIAYRGFIFFGLMIRDGEPLVIEYNVRMGDPETEVVLPRIESDIVELFLAAAEGDLAGRSISIREETCVTVMLVSGGYPGSYEKGKEISGTNGIESSLIFHAGTKLVEGKLLTNGGRVIALSSFGNNIQEALDHSYENAAKIKFEGKFYRKDIGGEFVKLAT